VVNDFPFCKGHTAITESSAKHVEPAAFEHRETHVNTTDGTDHLGDNDHVSQVGLDGGRLLVGGGLLLGLSELLDQSQGLSLETSLEPSPGSGVDEL
jgi:hypothetical protein